MSKDNLIRRALTVSALVVLEGVCLGGQRGLPAQESIANFGKISSSLYRGAQPESVGIQNLKQLGIKSIISLRSPGDSWKLEASQAGVHGIVLTNIPMSGVRGPKDKDVQRVLALIEILPAPVFIHCKHGCDRTGTIVACYRIQHDRWSRAAALREAQHYGLSKLERGMKRFIATFKARE